MKPLDVVNQGVATAADVEVAVCKGLNYPRGPFAWGNDLGVGTIHRVLGNLGGPLWRGALPYFAQGSTSSFWADAQFPTA